MRNINESADTARSGLNVAGSLKRGLRSSRNTVAKLTAAILTGFAAALTALADFIYPRELRRNRVIVVEPSAEDCAAHIRRRGQWRNN